MVYDARHLANFMLDEAERSRSALTPMALQKLVFFSHGWSLAHRNKGLVVNSFEAWRYGPVVRVLWDEFKRYGNKAVTSRATFRNPLTGESRFVPYAFEPGDEQFLKVVHRYHGGLPAMVLSEITHEAGMPWFEVRERMVTEANLGGIISDEVMAKSFKTLNFSWLQIPTAL
jgi:uncharacterized phage-associated protein